MKKLWVILLVLLYAVSIDMHAEPFHHISNDTLVIDFGNNKKVILLVDTQNDLDELKRYDLNKMLRDLNIIVDSSSNIIKVIHVKDLMENYEIDSMATVRFDPDHHVEPQTADTVDVMTISLGRFVFRINNHKNELKVKEKVESKRTRHFLNVDLGKNNYLTNGRFPDEDDALYTVKPWGSWYVGVNSIHKTYLAGPLFLEWGGGISWYNFKFQDSRSRITKQMDQVLFFEDVADINPIRSKLTTSYLNVSVLPLLDFTYKRKPASQFNHDDYDKKGFRFGVGGYAGYRIGGKSKYVFTEDGAKRKFKERDNFYLSNWRYGLRMQIGYRGIDFFANYDLNELFLPNKGPQLNAFSFGIIL